MGTTVEQLLMAKSARVVQPTGPGLIADLDEMDYAQKV